MTVTGDGVSAPSSIGRKALAAAVALIAVVALASVEVGGASASRTWLWSGSATLQGVSHCGVPATTWVWIRSPNGESGWATNGAGRYSFNFHNVPSGGMTVLITYGEPGASCHDYVFVRRPLAGTSLTVNLVQIIPNG
jgi:hypothetical protein